MSLAGPISTMHPLGSILKAALIAGLLAGLLVAALQFVWTEPIVDQAIALEEARAAQAQASPAPGAGLPPEEQPVIDRPTQKKGLFLGYAVYGLAWGLRYAASYAIARSKLTPRRPLVRAVVLAACSYWAVGLLPFLKYPANPPGLSDPDTLAYRQRLYLTMLVLVVPLIGGAFALKD